MMKDGEIQIGADIAGPLAAVKRRSEPQSSPAGT